VRAEGALAALGVAAALALTPCARAADPAAPVRARLDLRLNGADKGEALVVLDKQQDEVWVAAADLEAAGLREFAGRRSAIDGQEYVALRSLAPKLAFAVDERGLRLEITAAASLLPRESLDLAPARPRGVVEARAASAYLNYSARGDSDLHPSFAAEVGGGNGRALFVSGLSAPYGGVLVRGLSTASLEEPERLRRWMAGDATASLGGLGASAILGGFGVARDFSLDPYLVQAARPATTAFASSPSTLEVYVNGALVRRQEVAPGTLDLANIPVTTGTNSVRTVLRDAYGREQTLDFQSVYSSGLLAAGLSDFSYHGGFLREDLARESFRYGRPVALARHRMGFDEVFTGGLRFEGGLDRASFGPSLAFGTVLGEVDAELAGSVERARAGAAGALSWSWNDRRTGAGLRLRAMTSHYSTAVLDLVADRALVDGSGFVSVRATDRLGLGLELSGSRWRDAGELAAVTARANLGLGSTVALLFSATAAVQRGTTGFTGQVLLSWAAGSRTTGQLSTRAGTEGVGATAGAQRSLPIGSGYGYSVEASAGAPRSQGRADLQWQSQYGRYEADVQQAEGGRGGSIRAAGGAVLIGGRAFLSRPVESSFGLMRVGVPDVRGYLENQEVGATDSKGDLLVPSLQPRYANRVRIRASDIPMDYDVGKLELLLAPPLKGGAIAVFDVRPIRGVIARVEVERAGKLEIPAHAALELRQGAETLLVPATSDGRFFLDHVAPGPHQAEIAAVDGTCRFTLDVPDRPGIQDLGSVRCIADATALAP
jgi:outer membrane usher protein